MMKNTPLLISIPLALAVGLLYVIHCIISFFAFKIQPNFSKWLLDRDNITESFLFTLFISMAFVNVILCIFAFVFLLVFLSKKIDNCK